ncbi:MAG: class I SAM-dependent methyltransferase [Candidatus Peregrinibacteria bacterium]|nr:class I SAM-dependent methyltransferase [Candidatus Peregrinibacteria bacterium]
MNDDLKKFLRELRAYGIANDIPNVTDEVGMFLHMMIKVRKPKNILEIGCANGYSTIYMAEAAREVGSKVITVDHSAPTFAEAQENLKEVGLAEYVDFNFGDVREVLPAMKEPENFDFVFVDGQKASYIDFWHLLRDRLNPGAVLVWDDMLAFPEKTRTFSEAVRGLAGFDQVLIPIDEGDGILFMLRSES